MCSVETEERLLGGVRAQQGSWRKLDHLRRQKGSGEGGAEEKRGLCSPVGDF